MKSVLITLMAIVCSVSVNAQAAFWQPIEQAALTQSTEQVPGFQLPIKWQAWDLQIDNLDRSLRTAGTLLEGGQGVWVDMPLPNGTTEAFLMKYDAVMAPELAARFPMIRTYAGKSRTGKTMRCDITPTGFHAAIKTADGLAYVDPYSTQNRNSYISYYTHDVNFASSEMAPATCGYVPSQEDLEMHALVESMQGGSLDFRGPEDAPVELRVYRLALACTGEFAVAKGGTVPLVMAAFNTAINRVNELTMSEVSVKFELIANNDLLIFLSPTTDPYFESNVGGSLLNQNVAVLNQVVGPAAYDIGHVFTGSCTDVGGVAGGTVCSEGRGRGVTCHYSSNVISIAENVMAHELAHQFSVGHTWANCPGIMEQLASSSAFEPGSGTTIMSYNGSCGNQNIPSPGFPYYHVGSLVQFTRFSREFAGSECATVVSTNNNEPEIEFNYQNGFYIPMRTPFELVADATDPDGDIMTYSWEQYDLGPVAEIGTPILNGPSFRSFPPNSSKNRYFPRLSNILINATDRFEVLPTYSRELTFRFTVRDNDFNGGGTVWEQLKFKATDQAGPFVVQHPNSSTDEWKVGDYQEVRWDVANTDADPVNAKWVNIRMSVDGGLTYPIMLMEHTPNDGAEFITVPDNVSNNVRIRVDAEKNIFFDISNANFRILPATQAGFALVTTPTYQKVCIPGEAQVLLTTNSILGYDSLLTVELVSGLPAGAIASFTNNGFAAGESTILNVDMNNVAVDGVFTLLLRFTSEDQTVIERNVELTVVNNDFSAMALNLPVDGTTGSSLLPSFTWSNLSNAAAYHYQLATSPAFAPGDIVDEFIDLSNSSYSPTITLEENAPYFWRVKPFNECGASDFSEPFAFHTLSQTCNEFLTGLQDVNISAIGTPSVSIPITVLEDGVINDLNVTRLSGTHDAFRHIKGTLTAPDGTKAVLFNAENCGSSVFNMGLDDEAAFTIPCPPIGSKYKPEESFEIFQGMNTAGSWNLTIDVINTDGVGGAFKEWGIEFCASFTPKNPVVIKNIVLPVAPGRSRLITNDFLLTEDEDNSPGQLTYTVVTAPQNGTLYFLGQPLAVGGQFRQSSLNAGNVFYTHDGSATTADAFRFTVTDGEGGFVGTPSFLIVVDPAAPTATDEVALGDFVNMFPNPTDNLVQLAWSGDASRAHTIIVSDMQGRQMLRQNVGNTDKTQIATAAWASGWYIVQLHTDKGVVSKKLMVTRK